MRQSTPTGAVGVLCRFAFRSRRSGTIRLPAPSAVLGWPIAALVAFALSPLSAQPAPEIGSSTWLSWQDYAQDACLARAAQAMVAARTAFGLQDRRQSGVAGLIEAIDTGDTHATITCAADQETRDQRSLLVIGVHTSRLGLDAPLRDFLHACMTTAACSPQPLTGMVGAPAPRPGMPMVAAPGERAPAPTSRIPSQMPGVMPRAPAGTFPGQSPGTRPTAPIVTRPVQAPGPRPGRAGAPAAPVSSPASPMAQVPRQVSGGPVASLGNLPPPGPAASANLRWPRPNPRRLAARRPQAPTAPASTVVAAAAASAFCRFTRGPLAGRVIDYSRYPGVAGAALGSYCADGQGSEGVVVAPTAAAIPATLPSAPAQAMPLPGGAPPANTISAFCRFTPGPLAGRVIDYSRYPGFSGVPIGGSCGDGQGSMGVIVAPTAAAIPVQLPVQPRPAAPAAPQGGVDLRYLAQRFGAMRSMLSTEEFARLYANLSVLLATYGSQIGWVNGGDARARPGDPNRGLLNPQAHYDHVINGGGPGVAGFIDGRLEDLARGLPPQATAELARRVEALLGGQAQGGAPRAPAGCVGFAGVWNTNYGPLWMYDNGRGGIEGRYDWNPPSGPRRGDRLSGNLAGNVLQGQYVQPGFPDPRWAQGGFRFELAVDGNSFNGSGTSSDGGTTTPWSGTCAGPPQ